MSEEWSQKEYEEQKIKNATSSPEMKVCEVDAMYLKCVIANHTFRNGTLQSFMNELNEMIQDIAQTQNLHNHVDGSGNLVCSVKVEKEE